MGTYRVAHNLVRLDGMWRMHDTKGHAARTVPLQQRTVAALRAQRARQAADRLAATVYHPAEVLDVAAGRVREAHLVWRTRFGRPVWQSQLAVDLTGVCVRAGVRRLTPHGLRHAANTLLIDGGVPAAVVRQLAGHATESMTDLYTGRLHGAARRAVDALADRLVRPRR